jgi:hypothetical protein
MSVYFSYIDTAALDEQLKAGGVPFSRYLFWDADINKIDTDQHQRYIIERVLTRGSLADFYMLIRIYSTEQIQHALRKSRVLDPKTVNFCSNYFHLSKSEMHVSSFYD